VHKVTTTFSLSGSVNDYDAKAQGAIKAVLANDANVSTAAVVLTLTAGSVIVTSDIFVESQSAAEQKTTALASGVLSDAAALTTALIQQLSADGVVMGTPLNVEAITTMPTAISRGLAPPPPGQPPPASPPPASPPLADNTDSSNNTGMLIGISGGAVGGLLILGGIFAGIVIMKKKARNTRPYSTPADL
jgi:hypothetical protein